MKHEILDNDICVLIPTPDRLTAVQGAAFKDQTITLIEAGHARLIVDLTGITFIDSSGLGALVSVLKRVGNRGEIVVCGLSSGLKQMFSITRMDRVFAAYPDRAAAIAALKAGL
ncbi:MAG: STAS domain-containing protein [Cypionkella sp.]|jgi:anti-sigma B factor antagonist